MDGLRRRFDGSADVAQTAFFVVAHSSDESADQLNVDDGCDHVERFHLMAYQREHLEIWRFFSLSQGQAVFYRPGSRSVHFHGILDCCRLPYRDNR